MSHDKNIRAYNNKAARYEQTLDGKFTEKFKQRLVVAMTVNNGDHVLDVGCGTGSLLGKIAEMTEIVGYGTDISPQMVAVATEAHPSFVFKTASCEALPFEDESMDVVTVCCAYHHFPDVNTFAQDAARVLKPGGRLYIADILLPPGIRHIVNIFLPLSRDGDVKFYAPKAITRTVMAHGFSIVKHLRKRHIQILECIKRQA